MTYNHLLLDIGNTAIDILLSRDGFSLHGKIPVTRMELLNDFIQKQFEEYPFDVLISSVNLKAGQRLKDQLLVHQIPFRFIDSEIMKDFSEKNHYDIPNVSFLGSDLFCDIIGVRNKTGLIVLDLGTATKVIYLDSQNQFHGSSIFPGIRLFPKALSLDTSLLEDYPLIKNPPIVSLQTEECLSSGAILGTAYAIKGMVEELLKKENGCDIYLTGGNAFYVKDKLSIPFYEMKEEPLLVLKGIAKTFDADIHPNIRDIEFR